MAGDAGRRAAGDAADRDHAPAAGITGVRPCLWFDGHAEAAAAFYAAVLPDCRVETVVHAPTETPAAPTGAVIAITISIAGRELMLLNGAGSVRFTPAVSVQLECAGQAEVDALWAALAADGGEHSQCGWLRDRFGVWWQILPDGMTDWTAGPDPAGAARAMAALLRMDRIDLAVLRSAYRGDPGVSGV